LFIKGWIGVQPFTSIKNISEEGPACACASKNAAKTKVEKESWLDAKKGKDF
jgi:hypothetical protein